MNAQIEIRTLLLSEMERAQSRNPKYSLRAFAKKLGLAPSALSELLSGKRRITGKLARQILLNLEVTENINIQELIKECSKSRGEVRRESLLETNKSSGTGAVAAPNYMQVNMDQYHLISDWYYFAILSLSECADFNDDPSAVATRLGLRPAQASAALERLERLGLLARDESGKLRATGIPYSTSSDVASLSIRRSHRQRLELAKESLENDPIEVRDFSGITMAIDPEKIPEAKRRIKEFRRELCAFLESGEKKAVYLFALQLFPLSREHKKREVQS